MDQSPEKILVERIKSGDRQAFKELTEKYQSMVLNTCNGFVHNRQDAEDLTQDVFIEVFNSIQSFRLEAKLSTWIYRIAINKSLNQIRKNKRRQIFRSIEELFVKNNVQSEPRSENEDTPIEKKQDAAILYQAINSLPENQKIAFTLNKFDELQYKEIAEILGGSLSSVESLIHRAKMNLQKKLIRHFRHN